MQTIEGLRINMAMPTGAKAPQEPPLVVFRSTQTKKLPLVQFGGDILVTAGQDLSIDVTSLFGDKCVGFIIQSVLGVIQIGVNGGAWRTISNDVAFDDCKITSLRIRAGLASSATLQLHGV